MESQSWTGAVNWSASGMPISAEIAQNDAPQAQTPHTRMSMGRCWVNSLTMTYFHTGIRTIIGAESFHCPVRDGKEWDQLAMVIRLKPVTNLAVARSVNS